MIASLLLSSCTKNDDTTLVLLGTESYVADIHNVIPDTLINTYTTHVGEINHGYIPPKVEGSFVIDPMKRVYSNVAGWSLNGTQPPVRFTISQQHNSVARIVMKTDISESVIDTVYIWGRNDDFTVYFQENLTDDIFGARIKRGIIMTGSMSDDVIKNLYYANIIIDVENDPSGDVARPGQIFIFKDGDNITAGE